MLAVAPVVALLCATAVAVRLSHNGYAALAAVISLGASWVAIVFREEIFLRADTAQNYLRGRRSERVVEARLAPLEARYFVKHDVSLPFGGNVDHVVCGPTGAFMIETKSGRYLHPHLRRARRHAKWVSTKLDDHWVTPVICIVGRELKPRETEKVWILGDADLRAWIEGRRDRPIDPGFPGGRL
jgi:nuclease-like protein